MQTTSILFFSQKDIEISREIINETIKLVRPTGDIVSVTRASGPNQGWEEFLKSLRQQDDEEEEGDIINVDEVSLKLELSISKCPVHEVSNYFKDSDHVLNVDMSAARCGLHLELMEAVSLLDETARCDFQLSEFELAFGWQDVFDAGFEEDDYKFVARVPFVMRFWGWGCPHGALFPKAFFAMPEIVHIKKQFEPLVGSISEYFLLG